MTTRYLSRLNGKWWIFVKFINFIYFLDILVGSVSGAFLLVGIIGFIYDIRKLKKIYGDKIHENR